MKKVIALLLALVMCLSLAACGEPEPTEPPVPEPIVLTPENVLDYLSISCEFKDFEYEKEHVMYYGTSYTCTAVIDCQAFPTVPGTLSNVEITVRVDMDRYNTGILPDDLWHIRGTDREERGEFIEFTFKMPVNGNYTHEYEIVAYDYAPITTAECDYEIVAVTGEFTPAA